MDTEPSFDLEQILQDSTTHIKKISEEAQQYLISLHKNELRDRLTSGKAKRIAEKFIDFLFKESNNIENQ